MHDEDNKEKAVKEKTPAAAPDSSKACQHHEHSHTEEDMPGGHCHHHPDGSHDHCHHHHHYHQTSDPAASGTQDREFIYLSYLYEHNEEHTKELSDLVDAMREKNREDVSALIAEAQRKFEEGSELLHQAIHQYEDRAQE